MKIEERSNWRPTRIQLRIAAAEMGRKGGLKSGQKLTPRQLHDRGRKGGLIRGQQKTAEAAARRAQRELAAAATAEVANA